MGRQHNSPLGHDALHEAFEAALASGHPNRIAFSAGELAEQLEPAQAAPLLWRALVAVGPAPENAVEMVDIARRAHRAYTLAGDTDGQWRVCVRAIRAGHDEWWTTLHRAMGWATAGGKCHLAWQRAFSMLIELHDQPNELTWDVADGLLEGARSGYC